MSEKKITGQHAGNAEVEVPEKIQRTRDRIDKALTLDPRLTDAYVRLASIYQGEGMHDETMAVLDEGLAMMPNDEILLMMRRGAKDNRDTDEARA